LSLNCLPGIGKQGPARWKSAVEWEVIVGDNKLRIHTKNFLTVKPK